MYECLRTVIVILMFYPHFLFSPMNFYYDTLESGFQIFSVPIEHVKWQMMHIC